MTNVLSALEIFLSMRYINLHFTLLTYFEYFPALAANMFVFS